MKARSFLLSALLISTFSCKTRTAADSGNALNPATEQVPQEASSSSAVSPLDILQPEFTVKTVPMGSLDLPTIEITRRPDKTDFFQYTVCDFNSLTQCRPSLDQPGKFTLNQETLPSLAPGKWIVSVRACTRSSDTPLENCGNFAAQAFDNANARTDPKLSALLQAQAAAEKKTLSACHDAYNAVSVYNNQAPNTTSPDQQAALQNLQNLGEDPVCQTVLAGGMTAVDAQVASTTGATAAPGSSTAGTPPSSNSSSISPVRGAFIALGSVGMFASASIGALLLYRYYKARADYIVKEADFIAAQDRFNLLTKERSDLENHINSLSSQLEQKVADETKQFLEQNKARLEAQIAQIEEDIKQKRAALLESNKQMTAYELALGDQEQIKKQILAQTEAMGKSRQTFAELFEVLTKQKKELSELNAYAQRLSGKSAGELAAVKSYFDVTALNQQISALTSQKIALDQQVKAPQKSNEALISKLQQLEERIRKVEGSKKLYEKGVLQKEDEIRKLNDEIHLDTMKLAKLQLDYLDDIKTKLINQGGLLKLQSDLPLELEATKTDGVYNVKYGSTNVGTFTEAVMGVDRGFVPNYDVLPNFNKPDVSVNTKIQPPKGKKKITKDDRRDPNFNQKELKTTQSDYDKVKNKFESDFKKGNNFDAFWSEFDNLYGVTGSESNITANSGKVLQKRNAMTLLQVQNAYKVSILSQLKLNEELLEFKTQLEEQNKLFGQLTTEELQANSEKEKAKLLDKKIENQRQAARKEIASIDTELKQLNEQRNQKNAEAKDVLAKYGIQIGGLSERDIQEQLERAYRTAQAEGQALDEKIGEAVIRRNQQIRLENETVERLSLRRVEPLPSSGFSKQYTENLATQIQESETRQKALADELVELSQKNIGVWWNYPASVQMAEDIKANRQKLSELGIPEKPGALEAAPKLNTKMLLGAGGGFAASAITAILPAVLKLEGGSSSDTSMDSDPILSSVLYSEQIMRQGLAESAQAQAAIFSYLVQNNTP